jgi:hypothetical protein
VPWRLMTVAFLAGCATASQVVPLAVTEYAPRPADYPILLYSAALPTCAFEEIAIIRAHKEVGFVSGGAVVHALRRKARELGGDAVVRVSLLDDKGGLSGTVVRFRNDDCKK